ncbi:hypothetical protein EZS27_024131 [termite gut metagenome]|uniref:Uncharacterized protein n=1 Tax=termite gut metagenome TaxID=433724 RepID=A0A5J4QZU7_9ZZZZ
MLRYEEVRNLERKLQEYRLTFLKETFCIS